MILLKGCISGCTKYLLFYNWPSRKLKIPPFLIFIERFGVIKLALLISEFTLLIFHFIFILTIWQNPYLLVQKALKIKYIEIITTDYKKHFRPPLPKPYKYLTGSQTNARKIILALLSNEWPRCDSNNIMLHTK